MEQTYFVKRGLGDIEKLSSAEILQMAKTGDLHPQHLISIDGALWTEAGSSSWVAWPSHSQLWRRRFGTLCRTADRLLTTFSDNPHPLWLRWILVSSLCGVALIAFVLRVFWHANGLLVVATLSIGICAAYLRWQLKDLRSYLAHGLGFLFAALWLIAGWLGRDVLLGKSGHTEAISIAMSMFDYSTPSSIELTTEQRAGLVAAARQGLRDTAQASFIKAKGAMDQRDFAAAKPLLEEAKHNALLSQRANADSCEGFWHYAQGHFAEAIPFFEGAVFARPQSIPDIITLASALVQVDTLSDDAQKQRAIRLLQNSLDLTRQGSEEWGDLHHHIGNAYLRLRRGDAISNTEHALDAYRAALSAEPKDKKHYIWIGRRMGLVNAQTTLYTLRGHLADLESALAGYKEILDVCGPTHEPQMWARAHSNSAKLLLLLPDHIDEHIEEALGHVKEALGQRDMRKFRFEWANDTLKMAALLIRRRTGEPGSNATGAENCFASLYKVFTSSEHPMMFAVAKVLESELWQQRRDGEHGANLARAEACLQAAEVALGDMGDSEVLGDLHDAWAKVLSDPARLPGPDLEAALARRRRAIAAYEGSANLVKGAQARGCLIELLCAAGTPGDAAANAEEALAVGAPALRILTADGLPRDRALVQANLGVAHQVSRSGDRCRHLKEAIGLFESAGDLFKRLGAVRELEQCERSLQLVRQAAQEAACP